MQKFLMPVEEFEKRSWEHVYRHCARGEFREALQHWQQAQNYKESYVE